MRGYQVFLTLFIALIHFSHAQDRIALPIPEPLDLDIEGLISENELDGKTYQELDALRSAQAPRIKTLVGNQKLRESPKGYLELLANLELEDLKLMKTENRIRENMFKRIGSLEGKTNVSVGREFYHSQKQQPANSDQSLPQNIEPTLSIVAPTATFGSLGLDLAKGFLQSVGYSKVFEASGNKLIGQRAFGGGYIAVEALNEQPNLEAVDRGVVTFESGRVAGEVPNGIIGLEGLAIVVNQANPISSLSMAQIGDVFSGKTSTWASYSKSFNESILIVLPGQDKGLIDLLNTVVITPMEVKLSDQVSMSESGDYLRAVRDNRSAIGICRVSDIPENLKSIKVRSGSDSIPLAPTHENVVSLDYPLLRYLRVKDIGAYGSNTNDFIKFASRSHGQQIISKAGMGSVEWSKDPDVEAAAQYRDYLFANRSTPSAFKTIVENASRHNTPVSFRFVPKTKTFELDHYSKGQLIRLAEYMREQEAEKTVILLGYADNQGSDSVNLAYSKKRADAVAAQLKELGVTNIKTAGIGEDMPVGNNNTSNGRAANRRVEVWLSN